MLGHFTHDFYQHVTIVELKQFSALSMKQWYDATRFLRILLPICTNCRNREQWLLLTRKLK